MKLAVLSPVNHDGKDYAEGETVDIKDEAQAQALVDVGVAEVVVSKKAAKAADTGEG